MNPLRLIRLRVILLTAGLLSILLIMLYLTPYKTFLSGLILGLLLSCYNVLNTAGKLYWIGETVSKGERWTRGTGMVTRFIAVALFLYIASKLPHIFDVKAVLFGLPLGYIVSVFAYFQVRENLEFSKEVNEKNGADTEG